MNHSTRQHLKQAVDAHKRAQIALAHGQACSGCGGELDSQTRGCKACHDRKRRRGKQRSDAHNRRPLRRCLHCARRTRSRNQLCLEHQAAAPHSSILPSRPAGTSLSGYQPSESPVGRRPSQVKSVSAGNRHREDERAA